MARGPIEDIYALTDMQRAMLVRCVSYPDQPLYMGQWWALFEGALDERAFCAAWDSVVARHTALRSGVHWEIKKDPFQVALSAPAFAVEMLDWTAASDWRANLDALMAADRANPFDLKRPPLMRVRLVRLAGDRHVVLWTRHHLVVDGWSLGLIVDEVLAAYRGRAPAPVIPFRTYVDWDARRDREAASAFWSAALEGHVPQDPLVEPVGSAPIIGERAVDLPPVLAARLTALSRGERLTLSTLVEGAWGLVLARAAGADDVLFGCVETVRPPELLGDQSSHLVGPQIGILPARVTIDDSPLRVWLARLQAGRAAGRDAGPIGLDIVRDLLDLPRTALPMTSLIAVQTYPLDLAAAFAAAGLSLRDMGDVTLPDMPLNLMVEIGDGLTIKLMFDRRHVSDPLADQYLAMIETALRRLPDALDAPASAFDVLPEATVRVLTEDFVGAPLSVAEATVPAQILAHIRARPDAPAVWAGGRIMTYGALGAFAAGVATRLAEAGAAPGARVGVLLDRAPETIAAIVGVHFAGAAYVPVDPEAPPERRARIFEAAGVAAIVTDRAHAPAGATCPLVLIEDIVPDVGALGAIEPPGPEAEAYLIFTSGSTGTPKGVSIGHDNLRYHAAASAAEYPDHPIRCLLLTFPLFFDGSVTGLFCTLAEGGMLALPGASEAKDPERLASLIRAAGVTHTCMMPSLWGLILDAAGPDGLPTMQVARVAAEPCPAALVAQHAARLPSCRICNEYGPTEGTVWVTVEQARPETIEGSVAIGHTIAGTRLYVIDGHGRLCPIGTIGELVISGPAVARFYVGVPPGTALRWRPNPFCADPTFAPTYRTGDRVSYGFDGRLYFHGRRDRQLKISGYRIEPGEVEAAILWEPAIVEAAVVAEEGEGRTARLVAHIAGTDMPADEALRAALATKLPAYMIPQAFVRHGRLPRTANGKVDRAALPRSAAADAPREAPAGEREEALAAIWRDLLGVQDIGRRDDFFAHGGSSLLAMQMIARIRRELSLPAEVSDIFEAPNIADLALRLASRTADSAGEGLAIAPRRRARVELPI
ncbi:amino acid adenylation domain-containing protein [Segnochrobactrum spirostomi]|uniref:Amino acid adenylation domain-containing protein n=1 Tax=Segnochrobactrum spirostomi TaxID=2608987 RepID=A0A6A7Y472_9HYPH|nr:amino acid adenylation domain-containing protein [Segnochrobactrum spirostomi]MQT12552.1 amino acid adenylation domain-containing protein [Segnochrobactrum spirostomi]